MLPGIDIVPMPIVSVGNNRPYVVVLEHRAGSPDDPHRGVSLAVFRAMQSKQHRVPGYMKPNIRKRFRRAG